MSKGKDGSRNVELQPGDIIHRALTVALMNFRKKSFLRIAAFTLMGFPLAVQGQERPAPKEPETNSRYVSEEPENSGLIPDPLDKPSATVQRCDHAREPHNGAQEGARH